MAVPRSAFAGVTLARIARHSNLHWKRGLTGRRWARQYFGTDGIRGRTNAGVMTAAIAMKVGQAAGAHFLRGAHRHRVVIGKDTRLSGYMLENALVAGFTSVGMDVVLLGPMPTPAVAMLTRETARRRRRDDLGQPQSL